jgi:hypothetical protein
MQIFSCLAKKRSVGDAVCLLHARYLAMVCSEFWSNFINLFLIGRKERQLRSRNYAGAIWWICPWTTYCQSASGLQYFRLCCSNSL